MLQGHPIGQLLGLLPGLWESFSQSPWIWLYLKVFSTSSFEVSGLTLNSLIYFELSFVQDESDVSHFILLWVPVSLIPVGNSLWWYHALKRIFLPECVLGTFCGYVGLFLGLYSIQLTQMLYFVLISYSFSYYGSVVWLEIRHCDFQHHSFCVGCFRTSVLHINFGVYFLFLMRNVIGIYMRLHWICKSLLVMQSS